MSDIFNSLASNITPLHYAAINANANTIIQLILDGADPYAKDSNGRTPLHYAAEAGNIDAIKVFIGKLEGK